MKVMVFGTFDGLHAGHLNFFEQAREYGDYLIVVVGRDVNVTKNKGKSPKFNEHERIDELKKCKLVDEPKLGYQENVYRIIEEIKPDVICLGYDQNHYATNLQEKLKERGLDIKVYRLKPFEPEKYHSSILNKDK